MNDCKWKAVACVTQHEIQWFLQENLPALGEMHSSVVPSGSQKDPNRCFIVTFTGDFYSVIKRKTPQQRWAQIFTWWNRGGKATIKNHFRTIGWKEISISPSSEGDENHRYMVIKKNR